MYLNLKDTYKGMILLKKRFPFRDSLIVRFISVHERNSKFLGISRDEVEGNIPHVSEMSGLKRKTNLFPSKRSSPAA